MLPCLWIELCVTLFCAIRFRLYGGSCGTCLSLTGSCRSALIHTLQLPPAPLSDIKPSLRIPSLQSEPDVSFPLGLDFPQRSGVTFLNLGGGDEGWRNERSACSSHIPPLHRSRPKGSGGPRTEARGAGSSNSGGRRSSQIHIRQLYHIVPHQRATMAQNSRTGSSFQLPPRALWVAPGALSHSGSSTHASVSLSSVTRVPG